jgi:hypothetical protein
VDLIAEIRRDPWIGEEQKRTLIQIYESFRGAAVPPVPVEPTPVATAKAAAGEPDADGEPAPDDADVA